MRRMVAAAIEQTTLKGQVANLLRQAVMDSGKSQTDIADELGCRPENVSRWLSGRQNLTLETIEAILKCIGKESTFTIL